QSVTYTRTVTIPAGQSAGSFYMGATANADGALTESNGSNNQRTTPFTVTAGQQFPDLVVSNVSVTPTSANAGAPATVTLTVSNIGTGSAAPDTVRIRLAAGTIITSSDPLLDTFTAAGLAAGQSVTYTRTVTIPAGQSAGSFYMGATANADGALTESNGNNNQRTTPFTVTAVQQFPDLVVSNVSVTPTSANAGAPATVTLTVSNIGTGSAAPDTVRIRLAAGTTITSSDPLLDTFTA